MRSIPVFYSRAQVATDAVGVSPSARKPADVVESWKAQRFPVEILSPKPATAEELSLAHDPEHVRAVLACAALNGFGTRSRGVAQSLPWTTGSLLSAARYVLTKRRECAHANYNGGRCGEAGAGQFWGEAANGDRAARPCARCGGAGALPLPVAASPTSGFHHAGYADVGGFCTFNGLMVTILALRREGLARRVGVLDLDEHYGDGTADILAQLAVPDVVHYTYGAEALRRGDGAAWLRRLPGIVQGFRGCDLVLYQAGADPHADDPLGRGILSTAQLAERDRIAFEGLRDLGVPVVWNLAGGYQTPLRKVLDLHDNTMRACVAAFVR